MTRDDDYYYDDNNVQDDRRKFLTKSAAGCILVLEGLMGGRPDAALAAVAEDKTMTMQAPRNRKVGGLALKLRAMTNVMVK